MRTLEPVLVSVFGTAILALTGFGIRVLWRLASSLQHDRDATQANTRAVDRLTTQIGALTERVARLEGPRRRA